MIFLVIADDWVDVWYHWYIWDSPNRSCGVEVFIDCVDFGWFDIAAYPEIPFGKIVVGE